MIWVFTTYFTNFNHMVNFYHMVIVRGPPPPPPLRITIWLKFVWALGLVGRLVALSGRFHAGRCLGHYVTAKVGAGALQKGY